MRVPVNELDAHKAERPVGLVHGNKQPVSRVRTLEVRDLTGWRIRHEVHSQGSESRGPRLLNCAQNG
jgi:hypothetical protein